MTETQWDKKLKISTTGRQDAHADEYHYPYEPTPYCVLERLAGSGYLTKENRLVDYGCGKGRVGFFLNHRLGCAVTGIEYDEKIYNQATTNQKRFAIQANAHGMNQKTFATQPQTATRNSSIELININAENYQIEEEDSFYFFNPFSVEILRSVVGRILDSYYDIPRSMKLFFYYPNDEYLSYLMTMEELMFLDEIDCQDMFEGNNQRERILIFEIV